MRTLFLRVQKSPNKKKAFSIESEKKNPLAE